MNATSNLMGLRNPSGQDGLLRSTPTPLPPSSRPSRARRKLVLPLLGLSLAGTIAAHGQLPFRPMADAPANAQEGSDLALMFDLARAASASVTPGPGAGAQRRHLTLELEAELERFVAEHTNSAWAPGARVWLARRAQWRSAYSAALAHHSAAWAAARQGNTLRARQIAGEALGGLAKSLALAGRLDDLDLLEQELLRLPKYPAGRDWEDALEIRAWARQHPTRAFTCGLYCLAELGRLTQPGQFDANAVINLESPRGGFTAADLVQCASDQIVRGS